MNKYIIKRQFTCKNTGHLYKPFDEFVSDDLERINELVEKDALLVVSLDDNQLVTDYDILKANHELVLTENDELKKQIADLTKTSKNK